MQRRVAAVEHRVDPIGSEQQPSLVPDGRADGVAVARLHGGIVVDNREPEWRLPDGANVLRPSTTAGASAFEISCSSASNTASAGNAMRSR